jgi:dTDP-4-amino-4,6-dideoxygalactose transaminase
MITNDRHVYEKAIAFGHYGRHTEIEDPELKKGIGLPWGGYKYRMHQLSSAVGVEQLKKYPSEMAEIDKAMNYFWDLLEGAPGLDSHRPAKDSGSTKGGWYCAHGIYKKEELNGLSIERFCEAVTAEGGRTNHGCNRALHKHPLFSSLDVYGHGKPTQNANLPAGIDNAQINNSLPVSEGLQKRVFSIPWFKHFRKDIIEQYANAFIKVVENHRDLLSGDKEKDSGEGQWGLTARK